MPDVPTARQVMERTPAAFMPETAQGVNAVVQYHLTGDGGGDWVLKIADGTCTVAEGRADSPTLTLTMDANEYVALVLGRLDAMGAFASGKVKLKGDMMLAMKLQGYFRGQS